MVVKNEKQVEGIREILRRLESFFSGDKAQDADRKTLVEMERGLINMECNLQLFSEYRRRESEVS
jgi:hypothetical protein